MGFKVQKTKQFYTVQKRFLYHIQLQFKKTFAPWTNTKLMTTIFSIIGSHWLSNVLTFLFAEGDLDAMPTVQIFNIDLGTREDLDLVPKPRILHTHLTPQLLNSDALKRDRKIVLMFRNPRDTAVSMYHFLKKESEGWEEMKVSWNCFLQHWMKKSCK